MSGGVDKELLVESFTRIREDIAHLNAEVERLKAENRRVREENKELRSQMTKGVDDELISKVVKETVKNIGAKKKRTRSKRSITLSRIKTLASRKNLSLPEIKEIVVDREELCSKATFYRYVKRLQKKNIIDFVQIDDLEIVALLR